MRKTHRNAGFILPPAYPFSGHELFADLRSRLSKEMRHALSYERLAQLLGESTSTVHFWLTQYKHPHLAALMGLLERLPAADRHAFVEKHCRVYPHVSHSGLVCAPGISLLDLLRQPSGLSVVTGGTETARSFVVTALGHSYNRAMPSRRQVVGIDLRQPRELVPVESVLYLDECSNPAHARELTLQVWPRLLTSNSSLLLLNRVWSLVPAIRHEILRCATQKHVVIAEAAPPDLCRLGGLPKIHMITLSGTDRIYVKCQRL